MAKIHVYPDVDSLSDAVAERLFQETLAAYEASRPFNMALSGGSTPKHLYATLASPDYANKVAWSGIGVFFGDERTVPRDHPESNFRMANEALLSQIGIPDDHIHRIHTERGAEQAASDYQEAIARHVRQNGEGFPVFDLVLLGLGPDGHVASLFPDTAILDEESKWVAAVYVEKLKTQRISLTFPVINRADHIWVLVSGAGKADIVREILVKDNDENRYPAQRLDGSERLEWFLDEAAAAKIPANLRS